jgi:hypothetical protein
MLSALSASAILIPISLDLALIYFQQGLTVKSLFFR